MIIYKVDEYIRLVRLAYARLDLQIQPSAIKTSFLLNGITVIP